MTATQHFLLLHGAGLGAWIWDRVLPLLETPATALDLPGRGGEKNPGDVTLQECIDFVNAKTTAHTILVGHSFSAEIALAVAAKQRVAAVVLVGGVVPESGKAFVSLLPPPQRFVLRFMLQRARNGIRLPASLVKKEYCNDLDDATTAMVLEKTVPEVPALYLEPVHWTADATPRHYVKLAQDKSVSPKQQEKMIERIRATSTETIDGGHLAMLSQPEAVARMFRDRSW